MTIDLNFKDVHFWEPMSNKKYTLKDRVEHHDILRKYFKGQLEKEEDIQREIKKKRPKKSGLFEEEKSKKII